MREYNRRIPKGLFKPGTAAQEKVKYVIDNHTDFPNTWPCYLWPWRVSGRGKYGVITERNASGGKSGNVFAHRVAYELLRGQIPEHMVLDHRCGNVLCVNPWHLEAVTMKENSRRGDRELDPLFSDSMHQFMAVQQLTLWDEDDDEDDAA
jgi:hypothetical protein